MVAAGPGIVDHVVRIVAAVVVGIVITALLAALFPCAYFLAAPGTGLIVTDRTTLPAIVVTGDVIVHVTGAWSASNPTWASFVPAGPHSAPLCDPRCGAPATSGTIDTTFSFCNDCPGGGSMYPSSPVLSEDLQFVNGGSGPDLVTFTAPLLVFYR